MQHLVAIISVVLVLLMGLLVWVRVTAPSDGSVVQLSNAAWDANQFRLTYVLDPASGLRAGDAITRIDGQPLALALERGAVARGELRNGHQFTYTVVRQGVERDVVVQLGAFPLGEFVASNLGALALIACMLVVAVFVFSHRPADPAAQALLLVAAFCACGVTAWLLGDQVVNLVSDGPSWADFVGELALTLVWGSIVHFTLVAPGTGLRTSRATILAAYAVPIGLHVAYLAVSLPSADSHLEAAGRIVQISQLPSYIFPLVIPILMVISYRSSRDEASRQRLRWVLITLIFGSMAWLVLGTLPGLLFGQPLVNERFILLLFLPCPLALGAAILRYRLFDIEVILRRSLLYGALTVCVIAIYLGTTWLLSRALGPRPGLVGLLGAGIVALSVHPLRGYLQRRVGRLIYGERDDPYEVIERLGRIDAAAAPRAALQGVVETLAQTLRLPYAAIELRTADGAFEVEASYGRPSGAPSVLPLTHRDAVIGRLLLDVGPGREPFGPADQRLLESLTRQVSGAASTVLLTAELQRSRERLIMTREEERRRLHHRLHDGLGPNLAASTMQMEVAKHVLRRDPDAAEALLDELIAKTKELIGDVRRLVYNLRPPALDQLGLVGAIRERAAYLTQPDGARHAAPHVTVEAKGDLDQLPAAAEVALFWIAVEAVNNAIRHAQASTCRVRLIRDGELRLEVRDDGRGLPERIRQGGGLLSMKERAEELGGSFAMTRDRNGGTVVQAHLPISQGEDHHEHRADPGPRR